jgi:hypothetical protein
MTKKLIYIGVGTQVFFANSQRKKLIYFGIGTEFFLPIHKELQYSLPKKLPLNSQKYEFGI